LDCPGRAIKKNLDQLEDLAGRKSGIYVRYHGAMFGVYRRLEVLPFYIRSLNKPGGELGKKLRVAAGEQRELNDFAPPRLAPVGHKRAR
jgi:hypothetical protein